MYQARLSALLGDVSMNQDADATMVRVPMTDAEAITAELNARVTAYGGLNAYCRDFGLDKRNFNRYLTGRQMQTPELMRHLRNMGVSITEFMESAIERTLETGSEPAEQL